MITVTAKTVEDAITQASLQLGVSSDRIQYEVVEKGSAGVLGGLFGSKPAVIRAKKIMSAITMRNPRPSMMFSTSYSLPQ